MNNTAKHLFGTPNLQQGNILHDFTYEWFKPIRELCSIYGCGTVVRAIAFWTGGKQF